MSIRNCDNLSTDFTQESKQIASDQQLQTSAIDFKIHQKDYVGNNKLIDSKVYRNNSLYN